MLYVCLIPTHPFRFLEICQGAGALGYSGLSLCQTCVDRGYPRYLRIYLDQNDELSIYIWTLPVVFVSCPHIDLDFRSTYKCRVDIFVDRYDMDCALCI